MGAQIKGRDAALNKLEHQIDALSRLLVLKQSTATALRSEGLNLSGDLLMAEGKLPEALKSHRDGCLLRCPRLIHI